MHTLFTAAEAEAVGEELARFGVDLPAIEIDNVPHRRVLRCAAEYKTAAGPARVLRTLYSTRDDGEQAVIAVDLRAGWSAASGRRWPRSRALGSSRT